jgi:hypothetical protein
VFSGTFCCAKTPLTLALYKKNMKYILIFIRVIFYPILLIHNFIYGSSLFIGGYSWYTKNNYEKMIENANDKEEELIKSYTEWKEFAERRVIQLRSDNIKIFKVYINYNEMSSWLKHSKLENVQANRKLYVNHQLQNFLKDPTIK